MSIVQVIAFLYVALIVWVIWTLKTVQGTNANGLELGSVSALPKTAETSGSQALELVKKAKQGKQKRERRGPQPRTPEDCPYCCAEADASVYPEGAYCVVPYLKLKSKRGRPKKSLTEGFACHNPRC